MKSMTDYVVVLESKFMQLYGDIIIFCCRSKIHGRGLYCKRDIDAGEMVIEYAGEVIRSALTDKREQYYESKVSGVTK